MFNRTFQGQGLLFNSAPRTACPTPRSHSIYEQGLALWRARAARCATGAPVPDHVLTSCQPALSYRSSGAALPTGRQLPGHARPTPRTACGAARGANTGTDGLRGARHTVSTGTRTPNTKVYTNTAHRPCVPQTDTRALLQEWRRDRAATASAGQTRHPAEAGLGEAGWPLGHSARTGQ